MENTGFIKKITIADIDACKKTASFLQSPEWGEFKSRFGWSSLAFLIDWKEAGEEPLLVLSRPLAPGISFAYIPWGPQAAGFADNEQKGKAAAALAPALRQFLPRNTAFLRIDPPWYAEDGETPQPLSLPFIRAAADIQPPDTVLIDLTASESDILANMKPKWRYNVGLAEKKGVQVNRAGAQGLDVFYSLLKETAKRDNIAIHSFQYYKTLIEIYNSGEREAGGSLTVYTAVFGGEPLAAIVVLFRGKQATYLYGASSNQYRNLMAPYALQWQAIRDAKESGCEVYDLFGIPPDDNPNHPMAGLYRFKTGFGGRIIHRPGSWDFPYRRQLYSIFRITELARKKLRDSKKNRKKAASRN
ncbi:MAG: peptidoglycan bridge formation glycyltransferase FemA/FemB family protein [Treponema sp.]|nr:peptidoglycan bridge formation glycyltransferase FemA/FemB family protein [Treponema sp.]